jgi:geranylgeranylglycerol-phosphate geranylgeranyltransferase
MHAYLEILRPVNGLMAVLAVTLGAYFAGVPFAPIPSQFFMAAMVAFLVSGAGMTLNDYFDYRIDHVNRPDRPIPSGRIERQTALNYAAGLYGGAIALAAITLNAGLIALTAFNILLTAVYAWKLKRTAAGHFIVSWLVASAFLYGAFLAEVPAIVWQIAALAFAVNLARETTKAIEDYKGDKAMGARTLPIVLGMDVAEWLALAFVFLGIALSPLPYILGGLKNGYLVLILAADAALAWSGWLIFKQPRTAQKWIKIAMGLALAAVLVGVFI